METKSLTREERKRTMQSLSFTYLKVGIGGGTATVAHAVLPGAETHTIFYGIAMGSPGDRFCKRDGRLTAVRRLVKAVRGAKSTSLLHGKASVCTTKRVYSRLPHDIRCETAKSVVTRYLDIIRNHTWPGDVLPSEPDWAFKLAADAGLRLKDYVTFRKVQKKPGVSPERIVEAKKPLHSPEEPAQATKGTSMHKPLGPNGDQKETPPGWAGSLINDDPSRSCLVPRETLAPNYSPSQELEEIK